MFFAALFACHVAPPFDTAGTAPDDAPVFERRLRANYEVEEGLNLADGEVMVLSANNETEPAAEHADLHATLGRYIGLSTYDPSGEAGRLCAAGTGLAAEAGASALGPGAALSGARVAGDRGRVEWGGIRDHGTSRTEDLRP